MIASRKQDDRNGKKKVPRKNKNVPQKKNLPQKDKNVLEIQLYYRS